MINIKKYAAIDIGSNAMRLLVSNIVEQEGKDAQFNKSSLVRVPIRLGQDVFTVGEISDENIERMIDAMTAFRLLMKVIKVAVDLTFQMFIIVQKIKKNYVQKHMNNLQDLQTICLP